jgi:hypothetical protein
LCEEIISSFKINRQLSKRYSLDDSYYKSIIQSAKSIALIPEIDLLRIVEVCLRIDLVGEGTSFRIVEVCFRMD